MWRFRLTLIYGLKKGHSSTNFPASMTYTLFTQTLLCSQMIEAMIRRENRGGGDGLPVPQPLHPHHLHHHPLGGPFGPPPNAHGGAGGARGFDERAFIHGMGEYFQASDLLYPINSACKVDAWGMLFG